jgi:hypothetical protein
MISLKFILGLGLAVLSALAPLHAGPALNTNWRGLAAQGYDVVAYFTDARPTEGKADFTHEWAGAKWRFANAAHRDLFAATPEKYAPQFGGFCAWAVSQGYTANIDPEAWRIVDGKLYLNYDLDIQKKWETDIPGNIAKASTNWPKLSAK